MILAALVQFLHIGITGYLLNRTREGRDWNASPRDKPRPQPKDAYEGRAERASQNHQQALLLFAIAVFAVTATGSASGLTALAAWAFLLARLLYIPAYLLGWNPWRSVIWLVGFAATGLMLLVALF
nr:MAPEG family protein [Rubellimicrobium sp. CFH 75288]